MAPTQEYMDRYGGDGGASSGYQPEITDAQGNPVKQHVHHTYIWLGTLHVALIVLVVTLISEGSSLIGAVSDGDISLEREGLLLNVIVWGSVAAYLVFVACIFAYQKISYKHLYFTIEPSEFSLYKGIFNKQRMHVPYTRVQSVDQKASLLQRILGVCTVQIDTAGGASNKAISIPYVTKAQAVWLRSELFLRKQAAAEGIDAERFRAALSGAAGFGDAASAGNMAATGASAGTATMSADNVLEVGTQVWDEFGSGVFSAAAHDSVRVTCEYGLTNKELVLTGLSNNAGFAAVVCMVIVAVLQVAGAVFQLFPDEGEWLVDNAYRGAQTLSVTDAVFAAIVIIIVLLIVWAFSIVGTLISFGGFRARRRGTRIEVERGLLQHIYTGVDVDRVQAVVVKQTFIRRLIGYCELSLSKIDAVSSEDDSQNKNLNQNGLVIHPFLKLSRVEEVLNAVVPEYGDVPKEIKPVAKVALRRAIIRQCIWQGGGFWFAICVAVAQILLNIAWEYDPAIDIVLVDSICIACYVIAAVIAVMEAINAVLWARESGFSHNDEFMRIANGGFGRTTTDVLRKKIQYLNTRTNPLQRMAHTATVEVRTAAGVGGTTVKLIDAHEEDADRCLDWLKPRRRSDVE